MCVCRAEDPGYSHEVRVPLIGQRKVQFFLSLVPTWSSPPLLAYRTLASRRWMLICYLLTPDDPKSDGLASEVVSRAQASSICPCKHRPSHGPASIDDLLSVIRCRQPFRVLSLANSILMSLSTVTACLVRQHLVISSFTPGLGAWLVSIARARLVNL